MHTRHTTLLCDKIWSYSPLMQSPHNLHLKPVIEHTSLPLKAQRRREKICLFSPSFVLTCCLVTQYHWHPAGGACVCRKEDRNRWRETRYLMPMMGTSMLTSSGFWAVSQTTYLVLFLPLEDAAQAAQSFKQTSLCASWSYSSLTWQIYSRKLLWKISSPHNR